MGPGSHAISYVVERAALLNVAVTVLQDPHDKVQYGVQRVAIQKLREALKDWGFRFGPVQTSPGLGVRLQQVVLTSDRDLDASEREICICGRFSTRRDSQAGG